SAVARPRTMFAVGDEKQSIFSFQGADPALFGHTGKRLSAMAKAANAPWVERELKTSFRSAPHVLAAVDLIFASPRAHAGLEAVPRATSHTAARQQAKGLVELWPLQKRPEPLATADAYPLAPQNRRPAATELAEEIAAGIAGWLDRGRRIAGTEKPVRAGDILILVQSRGPLFHAIIKALRNRNIPNAGADRFPLAQHPAILDLATLGDFVATPADELALATILRSPLIGISETQLEVLCARRNGAPLWPRLKELAKTAPWAKKAHSYLGGLRNRLDVDRPYEFFARLLFAGGGLRAFHARMGPEVDDAIAEFLDLALDHERSAHPGLRGFLTALRAGSAQTKRELGETGALVRVMTVHGAKGLEAPIVILADASTPYTAPKTDKIILGQPEKQGEAPFFLWNAGLPAHPAITAIKQKVNEAARAEYHRKLYVALTRAENEIYLTGIEPAKKNGAPEGSWYELVASGLGEHAGPAKVENFTEPVLRFPATFRNAYAHVAKTAGLEKQEHPFPAGNITVPFRPAVLSPSTALAPAEISAGMAKGDGQDAEAARLGGIAIHELLSVLPALPPHERDNQGRIALRNLLPGYPLDHDRLLAEALALIERPDLADLFGPNARSELPIAATATQNDTPVLISGRIDRLVVGADSVLIVDFKSDAAPPGPGEPLPAAYTRQMGLYWLVVRKIFAPRRVSAAVLWTRTGQLVPITPETLSAATLQFKLT
ncbi:MAG: UvrD-helicase domain-containing protein, partial [Alphaproteobacteria bacterium]|nr:UvrD-helicase domain-containing protein [Alphaproteobacteria bacterium]